MPEIRPRDELLAIVSETVFELAEFDNETILSLVRPGRLGEWKSRLFELRVELERCEAMRDSGPITRPDEADIARGHELAEEAWLVTG